MDINDISDCPQCGLEWLGEGECPQCEVGLRDEPGCPRCHNSTIYDAEAQVCYNCGYEGSESVIDGPPRCLHCGEREEPYHFCEPVPSSDGEELLDAVDLVESFEKISNSSNILNITRRQPSDWAEDAMNTKAYTTNGKPWPFGTYKVEPYQPFFDLVEDLKKWHVKVEKTTKDGLNGWLSRQTSKVVGVDVTHMSKAFGPRIFITDYQWGTKQGYIALCHEAEHAKDFWKFGIIPFFLMQYILPFGPSGTALLEYRAYVAMFRAEKRVWGYISKGATERVAKAMASRGYKYCFPWPKLMKKLLDRAIGD